MTTSDKNKPDETTDGTVQVGVKIPAKLLRGVDREVERWRKETPGIRFTRSDVVRRALTELLERSREGSRGKSTDPLA